MDDIEALIVGFMCNLISLYIAKYIESVQPRGTISVHNFNLQGNAWLMEMFKRSSSVRYHGLLRMQRHVFYRLSDELKAKNLMED